MHVLACDPVRLLKNRDRDAHPSPSTRFEGCAGGAHFCVTERRSRRP